MESMSLKVPVTFSTSIDGKRKADIDLTEQCLSSTVSSCLVSWGLQNLGVQPDVQENTAPGVALGCDDGTVFILRSSGSASTTTTAASSPPLEPPTSPTSVRRFLGLGRPSSRSASPSSTKSSLSPFHVTRSRVVSAVTTEQAEAPKNYVDFEDEQERLRGMLKGKGHRDRHASTSRPRPDPSAEKIAVTQTSSNPGSSLRKEDTRSFLSTALSPASSTVSLSTSNPPSPPLFPAPSPEPGSSSLMTLRCHFFPPNSGSRRAITSLKAHQEGRVVTCLNAAGSAHFLIC